MWAVYVGGCGQMCVNVGGVCGWMWVDVILSLFLAFFLSLPLLFDTRRFLFKTLSSIMGPCAERGCIMFIHTSFAKQSAFIIFERLQSLLFLAFFLSLLLFFDSLGLEPLRAEPNGFRVHFLNRSDTVSCWPCCGEAQ